METKPFRLMLIVLIIFILANSIFILEQKKQAIVIQFGEAVSTITDPGLHFKLPFIQRVAYFDKMILDITVADKEVLAKDQKRIIVNAYAKYKVIDPLKYFQTVRNAMGAKSRLVSDLESSLRQVIGEEPLMSLLTSERTKIMQRIRVITDEKAHTGGMQIIDVRIKRADLPKENSNAIYSRMQTDREKEAKEIRAQGFEEAQTIKSEADKEAREIIAKAKQNAEVIRGIGDGTSNKIFSGVANLDNEFYEFYRTMQVYKTIIKGDNTTMVISPDSELMKYLK